MRMHPLSVVALSSRPYSSLAEIQRKYGGRVRVTFDRGNCLRVLESRDQDLQEREILREFGLAMATEYFADCAGKIRRRTP